MQFLEQDGKLIVGSHDPLPVRCPNCRRYFDDPQEKKADEKIRCPFCSHRQQKSAFVFKFYEICRARIIAPY